MTERKPAQPFCLKSTTFSSTDDNSKTECIEYESGRNQSETQHQPPEPTKNDTSATEIENPTGRDGEEFISSLPPNEVNLSEGLFPRIFMICRRSLRKDKYIDYMGEYHLEWIQRCGGLPIILPRTRLTIDQVSAYFPMDGLLLVEGEDIGQIYRPYGDERVDSALYSLVSKKHPNDVCNDTFKDEVEWMLLKYAINSEIPVLGICRGCQMINLAYGGTLYFDVVTEHPNAIPHISYADYDGYEHPLHIVPNTPLSTWYREYVKSDTDIKQNVMNVNSYHHQGIRRLAPNLTPMGYAADGLIEAVYDPKKYRPQRGQFFVGLQFHPERQQLLQSSESGLRVYEEFISASREKMKQRQR